MQFDVTSLSSQRGTCSNPADMHLYLKLGEEFDFSEYIIRIFYLEAMFGIGKRKKMKAKGKRGPAPLPHDLVVVEHVGFFTGT